jgi:hypothetical protein
MPSLDPPIFEHPEYIQMNRIWETAADVYSGLSTTELKSKYLWRWPGEEPNPVNDPYIERLRNTDLSNHFKFAIHGIAGLLSSFTLLEDVIPSLSAVRENVDLLGNDLQSFLLQQDIWAVRDLASIVLVDVLVRDIDPDALASEVDEPRPFLAAFPLRNVINWRHELIDGVMTLTMLVIRRNIWRAIGDYGNQQIKQYIVYRPGQVETWEQPIDPESQEAGEFGEPLITDMLDANGDPLEQIPYVWYPSLPLPPFNYQVEENIYIEPPLYSLLKLNLSHLRAWSEYLEARRKTNIPVPVVISDRDRDVLKIGTSHFVQIETGGNFFFAEPSGAAMGATLDSIKHTEHAMELASMAFLVNSDSPGQQTATEANLQSARGKSGLQVMADLKASAVQQIGRHWLRYVDPNWRESIEQLPELIDLNTDELTNPISMSDLKALGDLSLGGTLTPYEVRRQVQHSGVMYDEFQADEMDYGPSAATPGGNQLSAVEPVPVAPAAEPLPMISDDDDEVLG